MEHYKAALPYRDIIIGIGLVRENFISYTKIILSFPLNKNIPPSHPLQNQSNNGRLRVSMFE
jgi:hypothetical protein